MATRHILATQYRTGFVDRIDELLDEAVLLGAWQWLCGSGSDSGWMAVGSCVAGGGCGF
jgi:hypothetical protein